MKSLKMLRRKPMFCMACLFYLVVMISFTLAADFNERLDAYYEEYQQNIYDRIDWYENNHPKNILSSGSFTNAFSKMNKTCALGRDRGRYSGGNESFVYFNGVDVPQAAISFAGVFEPSNEWRIFTGKCRDA